MSEGKLRVQRDGAIGRMVFDNTARRNAINASMWRGIPEAMAQFNDDPEVRCIIVRGEGENAKVAIRNVRRDCNHHVKELLKKKSISEDEDRRAEDAIQKSTDHFVAEVDKVVAAKEQEIMTV